MAIESHCCGAAPSDPLVASPNQPCESFALSGAGNLSPSSGTKLLSRRKVGRGKTTKWAMWPPRALKICNPKCKENCFKMCKKYL